MVLDPGLLFGQIPAADWLAEVVIQEVGTTCDRIFTPLVTPAIFLSQILSDDYSCRAVVTRLPAWRAAR